MNCNILQIISLKFVHNGDYQKSYYFFCHKMMKQSYMLEALIKNYILTDCGVHTDFWLHLSMKTSWINIKKQERKLKFYEIIGINW